LPENQILIRRLFYQPEFLLTAGLKHRRKEEEKVKKKVLFICNHNAGRSQMAEALLNNSYGEIYEAFSAGLNPTKSVNPHTTEVLNEIGIDISKKIPLPVSEYQDKKFERVVITCDYNPDEDEIPDSEEITEKIFPDPYLFSGSDDEILTGFRRVRDEINEWINKEFSGEVKMSNGNNENNTCNNKCRSITVTVFVPDDPVKPPFRCPDTGRLLSEVVKDINIIMKNQGFEIKYGERPEDENTTKSLLLIDNRPIEDFVPLPNPAKYCGIACTDCGGKGSGTPCSRIYENIPESVLRLAVKKAANPT